MKTLSACYTVLVETLDNGAARAHLVGPDGRTVGMYTKESADAAVESACTTLKVQGARDAAFAIERNWRAQREGASS